VSDKDTSSQDEIGPEAQSDADVEAHAAQSEELPWCGVQHPAASGGSRSDVEAHAVETEENPFCAVFRPN